MSVAERIAEHALLVSEGNLEPVIDWLRKVGRSVIVPDCVLLCYYDVQEWSNGHGTRER